MFSTYPSSVKKKSQAYYSSGIRTHDLCNSRAVSYQLDHRDCPVARGSSNPHAAKNIGFELPLATWQSRWSSWYDTALEWTLPMKYANYIHACVQTLLVGKCHRVVHWADAQSRVRHAAISRVQNSAMFPHFANQNVVHTRYVQFTYFMGRVYCKGLGFESHPSNMPVIFS